MARKDDLLKELRLEVKRANQRIVRLEREFGKDSWGTKRLKALLDNDRLNAWTEKGRTKISKNMTENELHTVQRAIRSFLSNKQTSTVAGVKKRIKNLKKGIKRELDVSEKEAEYIFSYFDDENFKYLMTFSGKPSNEINAIQEAREKNESWRTFEKKFKSIVYFSKDSDYRKHLKKVYDKWVKSTDKMLDENYGKSDYDNMEW